MTRAVILTPNHRCRNLSLGEIFSLTQSDQRDHYQGSVTNAHPQTDPVFKDQRVYVGLGTMVATIHPLSNEDLPG